MQGSSLHPFNSPVDTHWINDNSPQPMIDYPHQTTGTAIDLIMSNNTRSSPDCKNILSQAGVTASMLQYTPCANGKTHEILEMENGFILTQHSLGILSLYSHSWRLLSRDMCLLGRTFLMLRHLKFNMGSKGLGSLGWMRSRGRRFIMRLL